MEVVVFLMGYGLGYPIHLTCKNGIGVISGFRQVCNLCETTDNTDVLSGTRGACLLLDGNQFHLENQGRERLDAARLTRAVSQFLRDEELPL